MEDAGANIDSSVDEKTGVPILSLYSDDNAHSPAAADMAKYDTLVIDMQDVGLRYYTCYISMYYVMDACAAGAVLYGDTRDTPQVLEQNCPVFCTGTWAQDFSVRTYVFDYR